MSQLNEKKTGVIPKPMRLCGDCLDEVPQDLKAKPLSKHDLDILQWKCQGRSCNNRAKHQVSADDYEAARKTGTVFETKCAAFLNQTK
jgi:hypothetical protein